MYFLYITIDKLHTAILHNKNVKFETMKFLIFQNFDQTSY